MVIRKEIDINNSIEEVWQILGHEFAHPYKWASSVHHSEGQGEPIASIECDERACRTVMGDIREKLTDYSDEKHALEYHIIEGLPGFIKTGKNAWSLHEIAPDKARLKINMEFTFEGWARWLAPLMKGKLDRMVQELAEDFAHYAEHGRPHPRKMKAQAKQQSPEKSKLSIFYLLAFLLGTGIPLYFIFGFIRENGGVDLSLFIAQLFANKASATFSADLLICSFIFWGFIAYDKKGKGIPNMLYFIGLNLMIGLSSALPLYLFFRERSRKGKVT